MSDFIKIRDVSAKYDISARTLRYYEDIGLHLEPDEQAYRPILYHFAGPHSTQMKGCGYGKVRYLIPIKVKEN